MIDLTQYETREDLIDALAYSVLPALCCAGDAYPTPKSVVIWAYKYAEAMVEEGERRAIERRRAGGK